MSSNQPTAADFFDEIVQQYDVAILRCVPRYQEMLEQMLDYVWLPRPQRILELGCGSGNLTQLIFSRYPESTVTAVDASSRMIEITRQRFSDRENLNLLQANFQTLQFEDSSFDLIVSSISIHHLTDTEKLNLFQGVQRWVAPEGVFTFCDQFAGETGELYSRHLDYWKKASLAMGATDQEWNDWMDHQEAHDYHSSLPTQMGLLKLSGFEMVDCTRRYLLWTTLIASNSKKIRQTGDC